MNDKDLNIFNMKLKEEANKNAKDPVYISLQAKNKRYETIERMWSFHRLERIVDMELLTRYMRAVRKYDDNYRVSQPEDKIELNKMMIRAYDALEENAINQGYIKKSPTVIFTKFPQEELKKYTVGICIHEHELPYAMSEYMVEENIVIFALSELFLGLDEDLLKTKLELIHFHPTIEEVKRKKKNENRS
tara:strand:- start:29 stop:598 length:570 start_codon:yes stop_codon:yes gene_type:complete